LLRYFSLQGLHKIENMSLAFYDVLSLDRVLAYQGIQHLTALP